MAVQIQFRRGLAADWTTADPTLAAGEFAIETDTDFYKIGDGATAWTSLGYSSFPAGSAPLASPTFTGTVTMADLVVNGTTSTINSATLTVDDKNIELGSVTTPTDTTADGGGITLKGATDKTFNWVDSTDAWTSSEHVALATGKSIYIDSVLQLSKNALAATVVLADGVAGTTQAANDNTTKVATTAFVMTEVGDYAPLASPTLTGVPAAPTASASTSTTQIATTAFVDTGYSATLHTHPYLPLAGGTLSGELVVADQLLTRPEIKDYAETKVAMAAHDVDLALGNVQTYTLSGNQTLTFTNPPATGSAGSFTLIVTNGASATLTWPTSVDWAGGTAPTLTASGIDILTFTTIDGGTIWYGFLAGADMK